MKTANRIMIVIVLVLAFIVGTVMPVLAAGPNQVEDGSYISDLIQKATENSASLVGLVMALTTIAGMFGLSGKVQLAFALTLGIVLGGGAQIAEIGLPTQFSGWFALLIYGLVVGASAVGVYETGKKLLKKPPMQVE